MRAFLLFCLLAGCAAPPPIVETELPVPVVEPINDTPAVPVVAKPIERERVKSPVKPAAKPQPKPTEKKEKEPAADILPPCESVPGDKLQAIVQKLECLDATADKKLPKPVP